MEANVVYVDFHQKTLKRVEDMVKRSPRKKIQEYSANDFMNEAKLMTNRCKEVMVEFLGWENEKEA